MNTQTPKRSSPNIDPPKMFGKSYKPPRGRWAGALTMLALGLVLLGVLSINQEKHKSRGAQKPRAVARPASRPLVIAVGTFSQDIPNQALHWLRYAFADSLSRNLSALEGVEVIDREIILRLEDKLRPGEDLGRYAGALGADLVVGGEVWQQEPNVLGATVRALSPVDIFFAEEVSAEQEVFELSALMAGYIGGVTPPTPWMPSNLASYKRLIEIAHRAGVSFHVGGLFGVNEQELTALLQSDPTFAPALYQRARSREALIGDKGSQYSVARYEEALADASEAYRVAPDDPKIAALLVDLCLERDPSRALQVSRDFVKQSPQATQLRYRLARALMGYGLLDDAKQQLTKIIDQDQSAGPAWQSLAWIALLQRDPKATFYARHALALEERWRAEGILATSAMHGWAPLEGSRVYVALAEKETLSDAEKKILLDEDAGLYPKGGAFLGRQELLLRAMLEGRPPGTLATSPFVAMLLGQSITPPESLATLLQLASVAVLSGESPEAYVTRAEALTQTPEERLVLQRWREVGDGPVSDDAWLLK